MSKAPKYVNTDLELEADFNLSGFVASIVTQEFYPLSEPKETDGRWYVPLEISPPCDESAGNWCSNHTDPESCIRAMLDLIESFDESKMSIWDSCTRKDFDIGYDGGPDSPYICQELSPETIARIARLGAGLRITVYPANMPVGGDTSPGGAE